MPSDINDRLDDGDGVSEAFLMVMYENGRFDADRLDGLVVITTVDSENADTVGAIANIAAITTTMIGHVVFIVIIHFARTMSFLLLCCLILNGLLKNAI